ncbi:MAG: hypothetical protein ACJAVK_000310 [Akkermansiaceae bacterium]
MTFSSLILQALSISTQMGVFMPAMPKSTYSFSFTAGGLGLSQCQILSRLYLKLGDWKVVKEEVYRTNALQQERQTSLSRVELEFRRRLKKLTPGELEMLAEGESDLGRSIALLAAFKSYQLIFDFCVLTLRPKAAIYDFEVRPSDIEAFFEQQEAGHPELASLTRSTLTKVRQNLIKILIDGGILSAGQNPLIQPVPLIPEVARLIAVDSSQYLEAFLLDQSQISLYRAS